MEQNETVAKKYIGVNLSPLSFNETNGSYGEKEIMSMASLMDSLIEKLDENLLFIPHVVSENSNDNDYLFLKEVRKGMSHKDKGLFRWFLRDKETVERM